MDPIAKLLPRSLERSSSARQDEVCAEVEPKICVCFPFSADIPVGGGHSSAMLLMRGLHQRGIRPVLALHGPDGPAGQWLAQHGVAFPQVRFPDYAGGLIRNPGRDVAFIVSRSRPLARFLRQEGIQIVHANDIWMMMTWAIAARLAGVRLVWHHRSMERYKLPHRLAFRAANKMIAVSPFAAGQRIADAKCIVIPNPFEPDQGRIDRGSVRRALLHELELTEPTTHLLGFFANLNRPISHRKRPLVLIEAMAVLKKRAPDRSFVAMYFGTVSDEFHELIIKTAERLGVGRQVFLMGFRTPPDPFLVAADVVVTPAVDEGFGRVPIEAMMLGTPVVASNAGNHPELVKDGETGSLVPPDDPAALADKILATVSDAAYRSRTVERARREACERFGVAASAKAVSDVYQSLLAAGAAASPLTAIR